MSKYIRNRGLWTDKEHERFLEGFERYRTEKVKWSKIAEWIGTRSRRQVASHAQKYFSKTNGKQMRTVEESLNIEIPTDEVIQQNEHPQNITPQYKTNNLSIVSTNYEVMMSKYTRNCGFWTDKEHERFLEGLECYGNEKDKWLKISELIETRSRIQVASHAQKYFSKPNRTQMRTVEKNLNIEIPTDEAIQQNEHPQNITPQCKTNNLSADKSPSVTASQFSFFAPQDRANDCFSTQLSTDGNNSPVVSLSPDFCVSTPSCLSPEPLWSLPLIGKVEEVSEFDKDPYATPSTR